MPTTNIDNTLAERGARYGDFSDHARVCQNLKKVMKDTNSWNRCSDTQKQALETIADKIARMLNGDPNYNDNWVDIIGYSQLVLDRLPTEANTTKYTSRKTDKYLADNEKIEIYALILRGMQYKAIATKFRVSASTVSRLKGTAEFAEFKANINSLVGD